MKVRKSVELTDRIAALDDTLPLPDTPLPVFRHVLNCRHIPLRHFAPDPEHPLSGQILSPWDCISWERNRTIPPLWHGLRFTWSGERKSFLGMSRTERR